MKTIKITFAKLAFAASFTFLGINAQAQIEASNDKTSGTEVVSERVSYARPIAFEAIIRPQANAEKIQLAFGKLPNTDLTITLFDTQSHIYDTRKMSKNEKGFFFLNFDIKNLLDGEYYFELQSGWKTLYKKFEVSTKSDKKIYVD